MTTLNSKFNKLFFVICFFILSSFIVAQQNSSPRNVILMIGDGMGFNQIQAALTVNGNKLFMEQFPYAGLMKTHSASSYITDSPAGGTAIATGVKTNNGLIGISPEGDKLQSILMTAKEKGMSTGIVVTCNLTHATPASFYAHAGHRDSTELIATWFPKSGIDIAIGGGVRDFEKRNDGVNLSHIMKSLGYQVVYSMKDVTKKSKSDKILALLADNHPGSASKGRDYLPEAVFFTATRLNANEKGFFLMVEGSQIDWAGHKNDNEYMIAETVDFDNAVGRALDFAKKDGNTLVIVTADHETGGTSISKGDFRKKTATLTYTSKDHTGAPVPVFAFGPGAELFTGWIDNIDIVKKIKTLKKWE